MPDGFGGRQHAWSFFVNDPIGTPDELVGADGCVLAELDRQVWGRTKANGAQTPLRFQGQHEDVGTGLFYNRFRYYDPDASLYLSPDPLGLCGGLRPLGYVPNPTRWIDPLGLVNRGCPRETLEHERDFDKAREKAFAKAGMTDPQNVNFTKVDPITGTVVEFKGAGGAKVAYDAPHDSPGPGHDMPHVGWQTGGKRGDGGTERGNITYDGPQHPFRSPNKGEGVIE